MTGAEGVLIQSDTFATAVILCVPMGNGAISIVKLPFSSVDPIVFWMPSTKIVIVALGLDVPVTVMIEVVQSGTVALVIIGCCAITILNIEILLVVRLDTAKQLLIGEKANDIGREVLGVTAKGLSGTGVRLQSEFTVNTETLLEVWFATAKQVPSDEKATELGKVPIPLSVPYVVAGVLRVQSGLIVNIEIVLDVWFATAKQLLVGEKATELGPVLSGVTEKGLPKTSSKVQAELTLNTEISFEVKFATAKQVPSGEKATDRGKVPTGIGIPTGVRLQSSRLTMNIETLGVSSVLTTAKQVLSPLINGEKAND